MIMDNIKVSHLSAKNSFPEYTRLMNKKSNGILNKKKEEEKKM